MKELFKGVMKKLHRGQTGFTLIELLVVVAILGAIAAVVVLNVGQFMGEGECEAFETEKHQVQTAVIAYMAASDNSTYDGGDVDPGDPGDPLDDYLTGELEYTWNIDEDGTVTHDDTTEDNPCED